jgi:hypothetical protein
MAAAGISLAVAIGAAGCGEVQKLSAKDKVSNALASFESAKSGTFTVSLDTTAADVAAISQAQGEPMSKSDQATLTKVLAGDVVFSMQAPDGKTLGDASKAASGTAGSDDLTKLLGDPKKLGDMLKQQGSSSMAVRLSGGTLVDFRSVNGILYVKADVKQILKLAGQDSTELDQALASLPPSMSSVAKAAKGEWVSLDLVKAATAANDSGLLKNLPTPTASPSVDPAKVQKLIDDLKVAYRDKATISELGQNDDRGTGYRLGAPAKQVAQAVSGDLIALVGKDSATEINKTISEIPDKNFALDLWVKDDKLTAVSLDLTQFLEKAVPGKKLAVDIDVDLDSGAVEAPTGATEIDIAALLKDIPAGAMAGLGGAGGAATSGAAGSGAAGLGSGGELTDAQMDLMKKQTGLTEEQIKDLMKQQSAGQ